MKLDVEICKLDNAEIMVVRPTESLTDEEYNKFKPVIENLGGHWRERVKGFVFPYDTTVNSQEDSQYFPTPSIIARDMAQLLVESLGDLKDIKILEPSAGRGNLAYEFAALRPESNIVMIEPDDINYSYLEKLAEESDASMDSFHSTFEEYYADNSDTVFDGVIMNPPFSNSRDINHIKMAFSMLKPGGVLVSIISENVLYYDNKENKEFVNWLNELKAEIFNVPYGAFKSSGTMIDTRIIKIIK